MPHDPQRVRYLLQRYTDRACTRQELEELFSYIRQNGGDEELHQFMETVYHQPENELPEVDYDRVYQGIRREADTGRTGRIFPLRRIAAAAVLLLLAGSVTWLAIRRNNTLEHRPSVVQQQGADVAPAANRAVLTLADGSTVNLDSAGSQVIRQGQTAIRQQNGQLLYAGRESGGAVHYNKLTTPRGGQFKIVLPDGTRVWLNSASSLRYPTAFAGRERMVELEGQGYFEVAQHPEQPFRVRVDHQGAKAEVQVLGTDFDVMAYPDETTVNTTLLTGSLQVKGKNALQLLRPGQQAILNEQDAITVQQADIRKVTAWKNGLFVFNNMALPAILREVARWYDVEIVYAATPSPELYGGGISRNLPLSGVLNLLEGSGYNHFRLEGRKVTVLP